MVLASSKSENYLGCSYNPYEGVSIKGPWIALVERGECTFSQKIALATAMNATGILVYNAEPEDVIIEMTHSEANEIVSINIQRSDGIYAKNSILQGYSVSVDISTGSFMPYRGGYTHRTSIIFVSLSFLILLIISMTWLVVYYVQRFRILEAPDIIKRRAMVKKIVSSLPKRLLTTSDKEIVNEEICPICIESYTAEDTIRILPCQHVFHRKCVDTWLFQKETCPMCKYNIVKQRDIASSSRETPVILSSPTVESWEPDHVSSTSVDSLVPTDSTATVVVENGNRQIEGDVEPHFASTHGTGANTSEDECLYKSDAMQA